jgi:hypothetical protein
MDDLKENTWVEQLPEVNDQIQFMKNAWENVRKGKKVTMGKRDEIMIEAILGTLCAAKMLTHKI